MSLLDHYVIRRTTRLLTASPRPVVREETKIVQKRGGDRNGNIYVFRILWRGSEVFVQDCILSGALLHPQ